MEGFYDGECDPEQSNAGAFAGAGFFVSVSLIRMNARLVWQLLPAVLCVGSCIWAVWLGCRLEELSIMLCTFFALCLGESGRKEK